MEDEEYKKLPIEDRCVHKLWKARVNGYEEVAKLFRQIDDEKSPEFSKYLGLVKKFVVDSNAMGQEKGLEATLAYIENYINAGKTVSEVMSGVVAKCIAAPKVRTRELALQVALMYIEIEKYEAVQEELMKGMEQKNPKIVAASISACTTALKEFGSKIINVKPLIKKISTLFADRDKAVRDEARLMVIEIYRWVGGALRSQLNNLQPVQITELETEFAKIEGQKANPIRYIRSQQQKQAILETKNVENDGDSIDGDDNQEIEIIDPYDLADPVDVLSKLPKDFYEKIEAKKWQERKDVLEILENLLKSPKLENGDYGDLVRALKRIVQKDSNVIVIALAVKSIGGLALGLKRRFQTYVNFCISALLEKFKEKKQTVVQALRESIDAVYLTTTIDSILDDILEALNNKNPSVKAETASFLARSFTRTLPTLLNKKILKAIIMALLKNINESDLIVRDNTAEAIGTLMKLVGEKAVAPFLIELEKDNLKMGKIKECCEKAVITVKLSGIKKERPTTAPSKIVTSKSINAINNTKSRNLPQKSASAGLKKKTLSTETSSKSATVVRSKGGNKSSAKTSMKVIEKELSEEEIDEIVGNIFSSNIIAELCDANWKTRLSAVEQFLTTIQGLESDNIPAQALIKLLAKKPGFKDTNFQVLKIKLDIVKYIAKNSKLSLTTANCCVIDISEKFGDIKNGTTVCETMSIIAEAIGLNQLTEIIIDFAFNQKNPKVIQEVLIWLSNAIKEFGFTNMNAKLLIENCKKGLAFTNPSVRQAAITLCGVLYLYMGNTIHMFFENERSTLRDQINVEFEKYEGEKPPTPIRGLGVKTCSTNSLDVIQDDENNGGGGDGDVNGINIQDLLPRVDISNQITESLLNEISDKNWKVRNEGLTKLNNILTEVKFIKSNIGDLPQTLVHRLSDSNTKIAQTTLNICETIAKAMGPPCKQLIKIFFPNFLQCLGDNKNWMRSTALQTINCYADQGASYKEFFENEMICDALKTGSPLLRSELWNWLAECLPKIPLKGIPKEELMICIPHLYSNLEDRNVDVRKNAQEAILGIMIHVGYESMAKQAEKLKLGSKAVIIAALEKVRPNLPAKAILQKRSISANEKGEDKGIRGTKPGANSKNAVKSKAAAVSKSAPPTIRNKKEDDIDTSPLLVINNMKHQRTIDESKLRILKWNFTTPREEFFELLKDLMNSANINKTLIFNMFHTDFRFHIKALEALMDDLSNNQQALISNLDLIFKWLTLRFFDTNPSVLLKGLEYLTLVFNMLIENKYNMLENEAASFIPYLVLKIGDPKDSVRNGVRSLLKQLCEIYSVSKLFSYIMEGVKSKNARQRAECLDVMGTIILDYGMSVCSPSPTVCLKEVAKQISDRDNSVRNAALNCIVQAYNNVGDKVYKMIGNISDKDLSLLEERIKRASRKTIYKIPQNDLNSTFTSNENQTLQKENSSSPIKSNNNSNNSSHNDDNQEDEEENLPPVVLPPQVVQETHEIVGPFCLDPNVLEELDKATAPVSHYKLVEFDLGFMKEEMRMPTALEARAKVMPLSPPKPVGSNDLITRNTTLLQNLPIHKKRDPLIDKIVNHIALSDYHLAIQAIAEMQQILTSNRSDVILEYEDEFIYSVTSQLKLLKTRDPRKCDNTCRVYRHLLTVIDSFYITTTLGRQVSTPVLKGIMNELISLLVDGKLEDCPNGDAYVRVVNLHCVKIIERSNHTKIICALVNLMHECIRSDGSVRHTDLVMKCLWRVIKLMPTWGDDIDYEQILLQIHYFFKEFPSMWWKNKQLDTPLRTIKTILHSSVKIKGGSILLHLNKIPNTSESEVESYLMKLLKSLKIEEIKQLPLKTEKRTLPKATHNMLTDIFQKIGSKDDTKEGLTLLFDFIQQHPEADIEPFLKKSSKFFQDYIKKGLQEIEESRKLTKSSLERFEHICNKNKGPAFWKNQLNEWHKMCTGESESTTD